MANGVGLNGIVLGLLRNLQLLECRMADYVPIESEHIVVEELKSMTNWYTLGIHLGMKSSTLNRIEDHYSRPHGPARCLYQLIVKWWNLNPHATWRDVVAALRKSEEIRLANSIEDKYKLPSCQCKLVLSPSAQQAEKRQMIMKHFSDIENECSKTKRELKKAKDKVKTLEDHLENLRKKRDSIKAELLQLLDEVDKGTVERRLSISSNHSFCTIRRLISEDEKSLNEEIFEILRTGGSVGASLQFHTLSPDGNPTSQLLAATPSGTERDSFLSTHWTHSTLPRRRQLVNTTTHPNSIQYSHSYHPGLPRHTSRSTKESNV